MIVISKAHNPSRTNTQFHQYFKHKILHLHKTALKTK